MSSQYENILSRFRGVKRSGTGNADALCPSHDDTERSLSVDEGDDGRVLVHCHRGCTVEDILARLGLTTADLMPPREPGANGAGPPEVAYRYDDENGELLYEQVRTVDRKTGKKKFLSRRPGSSPGEWIYNLTGVRRVLFGLTLLQAAPEEGVIFITEGEKDVLTLRGWGLVATTNPGGASAEARSSKWRLEFTAWLKEHKPKAQY